MKASNTLFIKIKESIFNKLVTKYRYYKKECKKKDKIIEALEEQINILRSL